MSDEENDELTMMNRVKDYNARYPLELAAIVGYPAVKTMFDIALGKLNVAAAVQVVDSSGESPAALALKETMTKITLKYAKKGRVMARLAHNIPLVGKLDHPKSYILRATKETSILYATNIKQALSDNLSVCTNVTATNITDIAAAILAYSNQRNVAVEAIQTKASHGTAILPDQFKIGRDCIVSFYDLVDSEWTDTINGARVGELALAKQIITTGHHDIKVFFTVVADEDPSNILHTGQVIDQSNLNEYSPDDDTYVLHIYHHRTGHYHFSISSPGRITVDFGTDIHRGMNAFTIRLKLIPPPPTP